MRMTELHVERFGAWHDLHLALPESGLNILYGPNEAGKSTLMRFVRALLYGFPVTRSADGLAPIAGGMGSMDVEHDGRRFRLHRTHNQHTRGELFITSLDSRPAPANLLETMLNGVEESIFEKVFAVGLREIQELGTLQDGEVADRIYGLTLGPDGQKLINSGEQFRMARSELLNPALNSGRLIGILERHDAVHAQLRNQDKRVRQHRELCRERSKLETEIADCKQRQAGLQYELRGSLLMQRSYGPWRRLQDCEQELRGLRVVQDFPERGVERLEKLDQEFAAATNSRAQRLNAAREAKAQSARLRLPVEYRAHGPSIQGLLDQRAWIRQVQEKVAAQQLALEPVKRELENHLQTLGPSWSARRLDTFDTTPAAHFRMVSVARSFRAALTRRAKTKRLIKRLELNCTERTDAILKGMLEQNVDALDEGLATTRRQLTNLEQLGRLKVQHAELQQRQISFDEERERLEARLILPPWVYFVLILFGISGVGLLLHGLNSGLQLTQVVGAVYALLVVTCGGICWAIKNYFENETQQRLAHVNSLADANVRKIRDTHQQTRQLITPDLLAYNSSLGNSAEAFSEAELIKRLAQRSSDLEHLSRDEQELNVRRRRLNDLRAQLQQCEREVGTARQSWQELLTHLGFSPAAGIEEAFETWKVVVEACELKQQFDALQRDHQQQKWIVHSYEQRICEIGKRLHKVDIEPARAWEYLQSWEQQLTACAANGKERLRLKRESRVRLREASEYQALAQDIKTQRAALLVQGGAGNHEEFLDRSAQAERRIALLEQLTEARMELERAAGSDRDLAIAEEDLRAFESATNTQRIETLRQELTDLDRDLLRAYEQLGSLKHEIKQLESNRESSRLRFDREQIVAELQDAGCAWLATELAGHGLQGLRGHFERTCQPVTLADASRHLQRLTLGKYRNVWTPLGERQLRIDDDQNRTLGVEQLSRGTREQLFLAIRLALVEELARQGTRLPMVLDDVLVNFDQERSEAATEVLRDFAQKGYQVLLFTCHRHLAERADQQGLHPIWLPGKESATAPIERMAG